MLSSGAQFNSRGDSHEWNVALYHHNSVWLLSLTKFFLPKNPTYFILTAYEFKRSVCQLSEVGYFHAATVCCGPSHSQKSSCARRKRKSAGVFAPADQIALSRTVALCQEESRSVTDGCVHQHSFSVHILWVWNVCICEASSSKYKDC